MTDTEEIIAALKRLHAKVSDCVNCENETIAAYLLGYADAIQGTIALMEVAQHET